MESEMNTQTNTVRQEELKKQILNQSHIYDTVALAKEYFDELRLKSYDITLEQAKTLKNFINASIYPLLLDKTYSMVTDLEVDKIKIKKNIGIYIRCKGGYFSDREAITLYKDGKVGFCGWASGCNRIPFMEGFIKWCDWLKSLDKRIGQ